MTKQQPSGKINEQPFSTADLIISSRLSQAPAGSAAVSSGAGNKVRISEQPGGGDMGRSAAFSGRTSTSASSIRPIPTVILFFKSNSTSFKLTSSCRTTSGGFLRGFIYLLS